MAYFPPTGSVVAFQSDPTKLLVSASIAGTVQISGNPSISGTIQVGNFPTTQNVSGSVVGFQGTSPWIVNFQNSSIFTGVQGSVAVAIISGSVAVATGNSSVQLLTGTANIGSVANYLQSSGGSVITTSQGSIAVAIVSGSVAVATGNSSVMLLNGTNVIGSVMVLQGTNPFIVTGSVQGSFSPSGNQSVSGTVGASVIGNVNTTITSVATVGGFLNVNLVGGSITTSSTPNQSVSGTVNVGNFPTTQNVSGSVISFQAGTQISSISGTVVIQSVVGTYAENSSTAQTNPGLFFLNVRNDTLSSVTSADNVYAPAAVGSSGEAIVANAPITKWVQATASTFTGVIQPLIAAQGSSVFTYITGVQIVNASANNAYLTFYGATSSVVGYTAAPANGGSNIVLPNAWKTNANGAFSASVSGVASVYLSAEGFISKT